MGNNYLVKVHTRSNGIYLLKYKNKRIALDDAKDIRANGLDTGNDKTNIIVYVSPYDIVKCVVEEAKDEEEA